MLREELAVVRDAHVRPRLDHPQRVSERHLAVAMMVAVRLPVRGDVHELRVLSRIVERAEEPVGEVLAAGQELLERHRARDRPVVEEDRDRSARRQPAEVRHRRIERSVVPVRIPDPPPPRSLVRLQDREPQPLGRQRLQRRHVDRRLRQPHRLRFASEAMLEVAHAPAHLRALVALVRQRQDDVVVRLRDRAAVSRVPLRRHAIRFQDGRVRIRRRRFEPAQQRRAEVEADRRVVVDDAEDALLRVQDAGGRVRLIALGRDARVPVVIRERGVLRLHRLQPRVLPRRLVEVAVDTDALRGRGHGPGDGIPPGSCRPLTRARSCVPPSIPRLKPGSIACCLLRKLVLLPA